MDGHLARPIGTDTQRSKFANGSPFEKKHRESDLKIIKRVQELAQKHSWTMSQVALTWSQVIKVSSPIVGTNTPERLREAIVAGKTLTDEEIKYLEELFVIHVVFARICLEEQRIEKKPLVRASLLEHAVCDPTHDQDVYCAWLFVYPVDLRDEGAVQRDDVR